MFGCVVVCVHSLEERFDRIAIHQARARARHSIDNSDLLTALTHKLDREIGTSSLSSSSSSSSTHSSSVASNHATTWAGGEWDMQRNRSQTEAPRQKKSSNAIAEKGTGESNDMLVVEEGLVFLFHKNSHSIMSCIACLMCANICSKFPITCRVVFAFIFVFFFIFLIIINLFYFDYQTI